MNQDDPYREVGMDHRSLGNPQPRETQNSNKQRLNIPTSYALAVREVIKKIRRGCLLPPITTIELDGYVNDWAEVLIGIVPEDRVMDCYLAAIRDPGRKPEDSKFPLKVSEILDAYYKQRASMTPDNIRECEFCRMHKHDPTEYPPCPFHSVHFRAGDGSSACVGARSNLYTNLLSEVTCTRCRKEIQTQ